MPELIWRNSKKTKKTNKDTAKEKEKKYFEDHQGVIP